MNRTAIGTARRFVVTLTVAGAAALGSVVIAPAASAAEVVVNSGDNGPDAFVILEHGKMPVFECNPAKPNQRHNNCIDVSGPTRF